MTETDTTIVLCRSVCFIGRISLIKIVLIPLAGIGIIAMLCHKQGVACAVVPPVFTGTFVFVGLMVAGLGLMDVALCILAVKLKKPAFIALFAVSFICSLCMGYLSSQDFAQASMNWIAEGVNVIGQGALLAGVWLMHKKGLCDLKLCEKAK